MMDLNVPDMPGTNGELEPFVATHNAHFVGLLLAGEFRRSRARAAAVGYGTSTSAGIPLSSATVTELAHYYNHLVKQAELDEQSADLFEKFEVNRINAESLSYRLQREDLPLEEKQQILNDLVDITNEIERLTGQMENLGRA